MIINLTGDTQDFTSNEISKLSGLLLKMQIKGSLEGIILEIMSEEEGLVDFNGNKIRVALPKGAKRGDAVAIKAGRRADDVVLKVGETGKSVTIKALKTLAKDEVFHIKIPEKVDVKDVILNIKNDVSILKEEFNKDIGMVKTMEMIEEVLDSNTIKIDDKASGEKIAKDINKFIKDSGINFESKLKDIALKSDLNNKIDITQINELKKDVKFKVNSILRDLDSIKAILKNEEARPDNLDKTIDHLRSLKNEVDSWLIRKDNADSDVAKAIISSLKETFDMALKLGPEAAFNSIEFLLKSIEFAKTNNILTESEIDKLIKFTIKIQTIVKDAAPNVQEGSDKVIEEAFHIKDSDLMLLKSAEELESINRLLTEKLIELGMKKTAKPGATADTALEMSSKEKGDLAGLLKEPAKDVMKEFTVQLKTLKGELEDLISELSKLKSEFLDARTNRSEAIKKVESLIKSFTKLLEGIEFQQLSNLKGPDGSVNYILMPTMFDESLYLPEIVITARKSKKRSKTGAKDSRIEIFLDLKGVGHIKADFSVDGRNIIGNFFSVKEETVKDIEEGLPTLKESLLNKEFNVVSIGSKKIIKAEKCDVKPEDKLNLEDLKIFDFKV